MEPTHHPPTWKRLAIILLMAFAVIQFIRSYFVINAPYLNEARYEAGSERMPYQGRILMAWIMRLADHNGPWNRIASHLRGTLHDPATLAVALIGLLSILVTALVIHRWYLLASPTRRLPSLPFALFLWMVYATYLARFQEAIYFPYDLLNVALFTLALYLCFTERYLLLAILFPIACLNRETVILILLPLAINAWLHLRPTSTPSRPPLPETARTAHPLIPESALVADPPLPQATLVAHPPLSQATLAADPPVPESAPAARPPVREAVLAVLFLAIWLAIHIHYTHLFAANATELGNRIHENVRFLENPQTWSQILSGAGFLLLVPFLWFRLMPNRRLLLYSSLIPVWILAMFVYGLLPESRVFGEVIGLLAVYCTIQFETATLPPARSPAPPSLSSKPSSPSALSS
jgi:hypothetical protein